MPGGDGGGGQSVTPTPVVVPSDTSSGFNWSDAAIGAASPSASLSERERSSAP
jgi:hypothetical protein